MKLHELMKGHKKTFFFTHMVSEIKIYIQDYLIFISLLKAGTQKLMSDKILFDLSWE